MFQNGEAMLRTIKTICLNSIFGPFGSQHTGSKVNFMFPTITKRFIPSFSALSRPMSVQVRGSPFKLALIQLAVTSNKANNLKHARERVLEASKNGANVVVLPVSCACRFVSN
jgi:hypothetical protein